MAETLRGQLWSRDRPESWAALAGLDVLVAEPHPVRAGVWLLYAADRAEPGEQVAEWGDSDCDELLSAGVRITDRAGVAIAEFDWATTTPVDGVGGDQPHQFDRP